MVFYFNGTWHWVTFEKLMMKIYDFFYSAMSFSHPITVLPSRLTTDFPLMAKINAL